jgi:hypothetical protein
VPLKNVTPEINPEILIASSLLNTFIFLARNVHGQQRRQSFKSFPELFEQNQWRRTRDSQQFLAADLFGRC